MPKIAIETAGLTKVFQGRRGLRGLLTGRRPVPKIAVNRIDLQVPEGEIFGLVGPNGAGKTTLIKMLTALLTPTDGSARIDGLDVRRESAAVHRQVGLVASNERSFYWPLSGRQNMAFFADLYRLPPRAARRWIDELFELVGLEDVADERFDSYSTGMRQRLALARGLLTKPRILFMDEPTKGVDPLGSSQIIELIRERIVRMWHSTLLITTHDLREIERLCDRVAIMYRGKLLTVGTLSQLRARVVSADVYQLQVSALAEERLRGLVAAAVPEAKLQVRQINDVLHLEARVPAGTQGLAPLLRSIVLEGGEVLACTSAMSTFDDVFHMVLAEVPVEARASDEPAAAEAVSA